MDAGSLADIGSAIFAGGSVLYGVRAYYENTFKENVYRLRASLEELVRQVEGARDLAGERYASQFGLNFSNHLRHVFGAEMSKDRLKEIFGEKDGSDFIVQALYDSYEKTDVAEKLQQLEIALGIAVTNLRRFTPATAMLIGSIVEMIANSVRVPYSVSSLKSVLGADENRGTILKDIDESENINLAYSELGISVTVSVGAFSKSASKIFEEEIGFFRVISTRILTMSEKQLKRSGSLEDKGDLSAEKLREFPSRTDTLRYLFEMSRGVFDVSERERLSLHLGRLEGIFRGK